MKQLLIEEMKRAIVLLEKSEKPFSYNWENPSEGAELKHLLLLVRKHSVLLERESRPKY
jgi:hypothetical protein